MMLGEDLKCLSSWVTVIQMVINVVESKVMWFSVQPHSLV